LLDERTLPCDHRAVGRALGPGLLKHCIFANQPAMPVMLRGGPVAVCGGGCTRAGMRSPVEPDHPLGCGHLGHYLRDEHLPQPRSRAIIAMLWPFWRSWKIASRRAAATFSEWKRRGPTALSRRRGGRSCRPAPGAAGTRGLSPVRNPAATRAARPAAIPLVERHASPCVVSRRQPSPGLIGLPSPRLIRRAGHAVPCGAPAWRRAGEQDPLHRR